MTNIETIKGKTHAQPEILRPKIGNSIVSAMKVDPITIHTVKGRVIFLNFIAVRLNNLILEDLRYY
jgi:hypothetical protein